MASPRRGCQQRLQSIEMRDIYAYNPSYEWTAHKTCFGMVMSYISIAFIVFYVALTTRDYIMKPPELVSQGDIDLLQVVREIPFNIPKLGLRLSYTNTSNPLGPQAALENNNPYVRLQFRHVIMKDQERVQETILPFYRCTVSSRPSLCPIVNTTTYKLKGIFWKQDYEFLEILVNKCTGDIGCAPLKVINQKLRSGEFRIRAQVSMEAEQFDIERFHQTGTGQVISNRSFDYYALPDIELKSDIIFRARKIQKEQRYIGSPPMPETVINVLSLFGRDTDYIPRIPNETNMMTFHVRLADNVKEEEVAYCE